MNMAALETKNAMKRAAQIGGAPALFHNRGIPVKIETHELREVLEGKAPIGVKGLQYLIQCQATLHLTQAQDDSEKLKNLLKSQVSSIRGFVLSTAAGAPVAYAIYYPMIDEKGGRVAYCEDFFIVESYRGKGVAKILFHELAKRTLQDEAGYLLWATDKRNLPVHDFVQGKLGAKHNNITTLDAGDLLDSEISLKKHWDSVAYETRPIHSNDVDLLTAHGFDSKIVRYTGDMAFKGMLTFDKNDNSLRAITPGWLHTSTFKLRRGLHLEQPTFITSEGSKEIDIDGYVGSIAIASQKLSSRRQENLGHMRWHVANDTPLKSYLMDEIGFNVDSMLGTPESELIVYQLTNGSLNDLAKNVPEKSIYISSSAPIGFSPKHK